MNYYSDIFVSNVKYGRTINSKPGAKPTQGEMLKKSEAGEKKIEAAKEAAKKAETEQKKLKDSVETPTKGTPSKDQLLAEAIKLHDAGAIDNDKEAVVKAYELLKKLSKAHPEDPVINAYYGSTLILLARDETDPLKRMKEVKKGLEILDGVVRNSADNIQARILRGNVCLRLPETIFRRNSTAVEDFSYLVKRYEENNSVFSRDFYLQLLDNLSMAYKNLGNISESKAVREKLQSIREGKSLSDQTRANKEGKKEDYSRQSFEPEDVFAKIPAEILANIPVNFLDNLPPNVREQLSSFLSRAAGQNPQKQEDEPKVSEEERKKLVEEGKRLYQKAKEGSSEDRLQALNFLREAYETIPEDTTIAACYADCLITMGLESKDMGSMFPNLFKGLKILNKALEREPNNLELRFLRGYLAFCLPEAFFHRSATAKEDLEYLVSRYEEDKTIFSAETYWQLMYDLAVVYKRLNLVEELKAILGKLELENPKLYQQMAEIGKRIASCEYKRIHPLKEFFFLL